MCKFVKGKFSVYAENYVYVNYENNIKWTAN